MNNTRSASTHDGVNQAASKTEADRQLRTSVDKLEARFNDCHERARERSDAFQKYNLTVNAGGIVATFSVSNIFLSQEISAMIFLVPGLIFIFGVAICGANILTSVYIQTKGMDVVRKVQNHIQASSFEQANTELHQYDRFSMKLAKVNQILQLLGFILFVVGSISGLSTIIFLDLNKSHTIASQSRPS